MNNPKEKLQNHLNQALDLLDQHTRMLTEDLDLENENLRALVDGRDETTQKHLAQFGEITSSLKVTLGELRDEITGAQGAASMVLQDDPAIASGNPADAEKSEDEELDISAKEASHIRHDEPVTFASIIRSLLMADEPGQREKRDAL
ncbi:MAG: hypothetical protein ACSHYF_11420 [Verrucomicrobiaceae bacterium]